MRKDIKIYKAKQGTDQWLKDRAGHFTASECHNLLMKTTNKGYDDLINRIAIEKIIKKPVETYTNEAMTRGLELESQARENYEITKLVKIKEYGFIELDEWTGVSIDGEISENQLIEIKCHLWKGHCRLLNGTEEIDKKYLLQMQFQMFITGTESCIYYAYYPELKPFVQLIKKDEKIIDQIEDRLKYSIEQVKNRIEGLKK